MIENCYERLHTCVHTCMCACACNLGKQYSKFIYVWILSK